MKRNDGVCEKRHCIPLAASRAFSSTFLRCSCPVTRATCRAKAAGQSSPESERVLLHSVDIFATPLVWQKLMIFKRI